MPKALFFPSYRGGGFGHIGRCLALAQELILQGWQTAFVLDGQHVEHVEAAGHRVLRPRRRLVAMAAPLTHLWRRRKQQNPTYSVFPSLNIQVVRDGFHSPRQLRQRVLAELSVVQRYKPDVLVGDTWLLTSIVGRLADVPVVQIIKSVVHPAAPNLVWWQKLPGSLVEPEVRAVFSPVLEQYGLDAIRQAEDLLCGDLLLVPSIPELDPLPDNLPTTHYVGPLTRRDVQASKLGAPFEALGQEHPLVYVTLGGGADPVGGLDTFAVLNDAFAGMDVEVVVSTGLRFAPSNLPPPPRNIQYHRWVPGPALVALSRCVVFHGGYGTTMETARFGVPSVVLPFHSEQEANGRRLEAVGMARVIAPELASCQVVRQRWPYGEFTLLARYTPFLSAEQLRETVRSVLSDASYKGNADRVQKHVLEYSGPSQAAGLMADFLG